MGKESSPPAVRDAHLADLPQLAAADHLAAAGDGERGAAIGRWTDAGVVRVAHRNEQVLGYCVTERTFFGHSFVAMLMVAPAARNQGVGAALLLDAQQRRATPRLFTSTNLSNQPMQRLLARLRWRSAGIVYGLDDGDPELIFLAPGRAPAG